MTRIRDEDRLLTQVYDEGVWAEEHGYARSEVGEQLELFPKGGRRSWTSYEFYRRRVGTAKGDTRNSDS